jgi:hypothetical protein
VNRTITDHRGFWRLIVMVLSASLLLTACGKVAETITEKAIEEQAGGDLNISDDGKSITYESEEGSGSISIQTDEDDETGSISGTDDSGNEFRVDVGASEIPDDFPMPVFEPSEVTGVISTQTSVGNSFIIKLVIAEGDADSALDFYEKWFVSEGMEILAIIEIGLGSILAGSDTAAAQVSILDGPPVEILLNWTPTG